MPQYIENSKEFAMQWCGINLGSGVKIYLTFPTNILV